jgi:hypothetical protein
MDNFELLLQESVIRLECAEMSNCSARGVIGDGRLATGNWLLARKFAYLGARARTTNGRHVHAGQ